MAEYMERGAALHEIERREALMVGDKRVSVDAMKSFIKNRPAADVAPVVHCRDCKWFADNNGGEWYGCWMFQVVRITPEDAPKPDDFCSHGELKEVLNIDFIPAADVAPVVHSYWEHKITSSGENIGICHNCKYPVNWFWKRTKYCPNCGAKMDGSDGDAAD